MRIAEINCRKNSPRAPVAHRCPICADEGLKNRYVAREMANGTREPFDYLLCAACGTLYLANPPADIGRFYSSYYSTNWLADSPPAPRSFKDSLERRVKNRLCRVAMNIPGRFASKLLHRWLRLDSFLGFQALHRLHPAADAAILDVGCGNGRIVEALDRIGFSHICGCDPFIPHEKTFGNGARLLKAELRDVPGAWDLIMLHHCFEHVPDPAATARLIAEKLKPGGLCLLRFPNVDSVEFTRYGENWWGLHAPRHCHLLSQNALNLVCRDTGMHIEQVWCDSQPDHYYYSYEYMLDLADNDPGSVRVLQKKSPHWNELERAHIAHNVPWYNEQLIGDWIVYVLRKNR